MALSQQPLLHWEPVHFTGPGFCLWNPGHDLNRAERWQCEVAALSGLRTRHFLGPRAWFFDSKSICHSHQHGDFLSDLLATAKWESSSEGRPSSGDHYGIFLRNTEILLHSSAAKTQFSGSLWALCHLCQHDVLGIFIRIAVADRSPPFGSEDLPEAGMNNL